MTFKLAPAYRSTARLAGPPPSRATTRPPTSPSRTLAVAASGTALVMAVFSAFIVTVSDSVRALHAGVASEAWALAGMSLGLAAALLTAGALADDRGHGRVLRTSAGMLAGASALGALAPNVEMLVAARILQGVAGGGVLAASLGSIGRTFPAGPARTRATGVWGAALGAGVAIGPLTGAALAAGLGWRSGFWVEAGGAMAVAVTASTGTEPSAAVRRRLDLPGIATLGASMALLTAGLIESRRGWTDLTTLVLIAAATVMLGLFAAVELRSRRPMLDPLLLAQPQFLASVSGALFTGLAIVGLMSYAPALMQLALHVSVLGSAAILLAWSATSMAVALAAGLLPGRLSAQTRLLIGLALAAIGELALTGLNPVTGWTQLLPGLFVTGIGSGIINAALGRLAVESAPPGRAGLGSGANNTARYLGGAAGAALVVSIASGDGPQALIDGWRTAALVSAGAAALGLVTVASCRHWRRRDSSPATQPAGAGVRDRQPMTTHHEAWVGRHDRRSRLTEPRHRTATSRSAPRQPAQHHQSTKNEYLLGTVHALPLPTAHPSSDAFPARTSPAPCRGKSGVR